VIDHSDIHFGNFDGFSWIRCSGRGNFEVSIPLKQCAENLLASGCRCLVIDLEACTAMDSTFMGTLTGLSLRLTKQAGGGRLEIAAANEKNTNSLEDLGLDALMEINPSSAPWQKNLAEIRLQLRAWDSGSRLSMHERGVQVLDAHKNLAATNESNARKFETVLEILEKEVTPPASKPES
jgi:anti-sigma B factor antagonist